MSVLDRAGELLAMAHKDFDALRGMRDNPLFADEIFGFHTQQAIEKLLKAWLAALSVSFPLTHDLSRFLGLLHYFRRVIPACAGVMDFLCLLCDISYNLDLKKLPARTRQEHTAFVSVSCARTTARTTLRLPMAGDPHG